MTTIAINRRRDEPPPRQRRPSWFWWTLGNLTALCFAVLAWVGCLFLFSHPEHPRNYQLLERLGRTPQLTAFTALNAPAGTPANPRSLYRKFLPLTNRQLALLNPRLLRNYIHNFDQPLLNTYIEGEFRIRTVRPLTPGDLFFPGFAVRAQAEVRHHQNQGTAAYPVWIDYLFPTARVEAANWFTPGDLILIEKISDCAVVLHASRTTGDDPQLVLTVVPIACGEHAVGARTFPIAPPARLNPTARLPAFPPPTGVEQTR
jgi:hypothetical protein